MAVWLILNETWKSKLEIQVNLILRISGVMCGVAKEIVR
jgi:hypothetical protein